MSSANNNNFTSFPIGMPFLSFSYSTVLSVTFTAVLNGRGENGHPWFLLDPWGKCFIISTVSMMLDVFFFFSTDVRLSCWGSSFSSFPCWLNVFSVKLLLNFVKTFFCLYRMEQWPKPAQLCIHEATNLGVVGYAVVDNWMVLVPECGAIITKT